MTPPEGPGNETDLSTQQTETQEKAWLSRPHAEPLRPQDHQCAAQQGKEKTLGLKVTVSRRPAGLSGAGFSARHRLKDKAAFRAVFSSGRRIPAAQFVFLFRPNDQDIARLGLAVPKRHIKHAVKRNRIKRVLRESFRLKQAEFRGLDLVILVRRPLTHINKHNFDRLLEGCRRKIQCARQS